MDIYYTVSYSDVHVVQYYRQNHQNPYDDALAISYKLNPASITSTHTGVGMAGPFAAAANVPVDVQSAGKRQRIAAIDFGTTSCSLAYTLSDKDHVVNMGLNWVLERVPTAILLKKIGPFPHSFKVAKFGFQAQDEITKLGAKLQEYIYFECFKMKLSQEAVSQ